MTSPQTLYTKADHVKRTWAKRCNKAVFFSSENDRHFPVIGLNASEGRDHLTEKTMQAFRYIYNYFIDEADWFLKADDDTYVVYENLEFFLSRQNAASPVIFGQHFFFKPKKFNYFHGGSGYVINKKALKLFGKFGHNVTICKQEGNKEDIHFANCMRDLGVKFGNSSDEQGRSRFHAFPPEVHVSGKYPKWYYTHDTLGAHYGVESISDFPISFHKVTPEHMYTLEFYAYHFRPYCSILE